MKYLITLVVALLMTLLVIGAEKALADNVHPINTLTPAARTVCVVGDPSIYEWVKAHAAEEPDLQFSLLHDHTADPPQPLVHYYAENANLNSCGAIMSWITKTSTPTQMMEAFAAVKLAMAMHKSPILVGIEPDHPSFAQWKNHLALKGITLQTSLPNVWIGKAYVAGRVGTRAGLPLSE